MTDETSPLEGLSPAELIELRCEAFVRGDFATVYDSYHAEANFRGHFPSRREYLDYAKTRLLGVFEICSWTILKTSVPEGGDVRVLYRMTARCEGETMETLEMAGLRLTDDGWRYLWGEKLPRAVFDGPVDEVDFSLFERPLGQVRY